MSSYRPQTSRRPGFTLIELLTVIAIIGILAAILIPVVGKVRQTARTSQSVSNLRQIAGAMSLYANDNKQQFPVSSANAFSNAGDDWWPKAIMPYISGGNRVYDQTKPPAIMVSPHKEQSAAVSYGMNAVIGAMAQRNFQLQYNVTRTLLVADSEGSHSLGLGNPASTGSRVNARNGASTEGARDGKAAVAYLDASVRLFDAVEVNRINASTGLNTAWRMR